jgi:ketosteroid isomerase-like protein
MVSIEAEKIEIERSLKRIEEAERRKDFDALFEELTEDCIGLVSKRPPIHIPGYRGLRVWRYGLGLWRFCL